MTINGAQLGAAGTRVTKRLGPDDEVWAYVWQSIVGAVALDLVLTLSLMSYLIIGWGALSVFLSLVGFLVGMVVLVFGRVQGKWLRRLFGNLWAVGALIPVIPLFENGAYLYPLGQRWYAMIQNGLSLIGAQLAVVGLLPWWAYALAGAILLAIWIKAKWKAAVAVAALAVVAGVVALSDGEEWLAAWHALKWLLVPYSWPVIGFALLLALVMAKEMLFPSLEWTFQPVSLEELKEVGLIGLWMPGLFSKSQETDDPTPEQTVRAAHRDDTGNGSKEKYGFLPSSNRARDFYKAIYRGRGFTLSTAREVGVGRRTFENKIRKVFLDRHWLKWRDDEHHDQGVVLTQAGNEMIEALVLNDPRG